AAPARYQRLTFRRGALSIARFAPDGETVVYGAAWEGKPVEIFQSRRAGGELALGLRGADLFSVSRLGGMRILLPRRRGHSMETRLGTLARVPLSGGTPRELADDVRLADWMPDGQSLVAVREVQGRQRLEFPLGRVLYESPGWLTSLRVSRDGERVAFLESEAVGAAGSKC